ncbi:Dabb family protein [Muricauda sp. CAU 1633]|uniref:Dabb family protein n=1 Tax=Allomuricauda sp. CAU 1633 TaxID=2816036 RepID=UPI001A8E681C|nr:Dabb family protein [Muricauda sp. CAU 1633]MBO0322773.1 Dabb family protein [Muricauda sp. CAU 1633]
MKNLSLSIFAVFLLLGCGQKTQEPTKEEAVEKTEIVTEEVAQPLLRHVVLFKFKETSSEAEVEEVKEAFNALPSKISEIKGYEWGLNNSPENLNRGLTHCYFLTFTSEADRDAYLIHPDHKAFGEVAGPHIGDVLVVDYWAN